MTRIHKAWIAPDFLDICRAIDDGHRASSRGQHSAGLQSSGGIIRFLELYATLADIKDIAAKLHCSFNIRNVASAIRDEADHRNRPPSTVLVDMLGITISN